MAVGLSVVCLSAGEHGQYEVERTRQNLEVVDKSHSSAATPKGSTRTPLGPNNFQLQHKCSVFYIHPIIDA